MKKKTKWFDSSIIKEDHSKNTANTKHFILNNGTRKSILSPTPINYFDTQEKTWKSIDSSLQKTGNVYTANIGKYHAKLSKENDNEKIEVYDGDNKISWEYLGTNATLLPMNNQSAVAKRKSKLNIHTIPKDTLGIAHAEHAIFSEAEGNVDLDYIIEGNGVKENIIIKEKSDNYRYYFSLKVIGFEIKVANDGIGLEFYKPISESKNETENSLTPEFIMPAPFMYDANDNRSNDVTYTLDKIDNNSYIFSIIANAEWINATERIFPVCVDPNLMTINNSDISVTHDKYRWCDCCSSNSCTGSYWKYMGETDRIGVYLSNTGEEKITATVHINKDILDIARNKLISANLIFQQDETVNYSTSAQITIGENSYTHYNKESLIVNITSLCNYAAGDIDIELSIDSANKYRKFYIPTLEINYQPLKEDPINKTISLENDVSAELDVISGNTTVVFDDISDPNLGVSIAHIYKPNNEFLEYGENFRLNIDEQLIRISSSPNGAEYAYTDSLGNVHTFKEHFYRIGEIGEKIYITEEISSIIATTDGRLWLNDFEVFRELTTDKGLRATSRLEDIVNNSEWVEQRLDEEKQLEEQTKSYKNTLCNFVSVKKNDGSITATVTEDMLSSPDSIEMFLYDNGCTSHMILSKEEALSYQALLTQEKALKASKRALEFQKASIINTAKSLSVQLNATDSTAYQLQACTVQETSLGLEERTLQELESSTLKTDKLTFIGTQRTLLNENRTLINAQSADLTKQKELIAEQIRAFPITDWGIPNGTAGTITNQYHNIQDQIVISGKQLTDLETQIDLYSEKSTKYISQFKSYYKKYLNLKNQLDSLKMQVPVAYLISDSAVKGFNSNGELVIIQDKYGKYVAIERQKYNSEGNTRVTAIYDQDSKTVTFSYNGNNRLSEICNSIGERVNFRYNESNFLTEIEKPNHPTLTLSYKSAAYIDRISNISSSDNNSTELLYNTTGALTKITRKTSITTIEQDNVVEGASSNVSAMSIKYSAADVRITYDNIKQEIYTINAETSLIDAHYELINNLVTNAERYVYDGYIIIKTEHAARSCLNRYTYTSFAEYMQIETVEEVEYNSFKETVKTTTSKYAVPRTSEDSPIEQTTSEYIYNDSHKLIEKKATHCYFEAAQPSDTTVTVETYLYNTSGALVRKESYVEGEELKTGINIEEHVFNNKGIEIQSFSYNSLDPSSKFYTENEIDENGKTLASFDESGENKTFFDYESDGMTVKTERLPNGSKFSYGRDKDGTVTAITHSTENGEENSTTQIRTLDTITQIKSGNNTVKYTYDNKRRVKSVSLNGINDYVTYSYSGDNTNAEKVTATMADGTIATSTKNAHGNVTKSTVGNRTVTNTYNSDNQLTKTVDSVSGTTTLSYNNDGNVTAVAAPDHSEAFTYHESNKLLESKTITNNGINHSYTYAYKSTANKALDSITIDGKIVRPNTDALGRNTGKTIEIGENKIAEEKISYVKFGDHATSLPSNIRFAANGVFNESIQYKYDSMGNIIEVFENGRTACRYEYDALGRLTREDNVAFGKTTTWGYDNNGNIIAKYEYAITTKPTNELHLLDCTHKLYTYDDNSDQLMSYNDEAFVYDAIGNPTTYRGKNATWQYGRQLATYDGNTFTYDAKGRRTAKNGITFTYDSNGNLIKQSNGLEFFYDHTGVFAIKYNNATYFYRKNAQNDIIALLDNNGSVVVKYKYDAWGICKVLNADGSMITDDTHIGILNPFRYRSYYFDTETNLYFLKTRYYDPEIGRFMTIDDISYLDPKRINGLNLYAYCLNNPVKYVDYNGTSVTAILIGLGIAAIVGGVLGGVIGYNNGYTGWDLAKSILLGVGLGLAVGGAFVASAAVFTGAIAGATATIFGVSVTQAFGIGALAFDAFAYLIAPLLGMEMDGIEYEPYTHQYTYPY